VSGIVKPYTRRDGGRQPHLLRTRRPLRGLPQLADRACATRERVARPSAAQMN
jgi:hypothetical protein